jgi:hypothetical protein
MPYKDPEKRRENQRERRRRYRKGNPEKHAAEHRRGNLKRRYGITPEDYDYLSATQSGACAVCHQPCPSGWRLSIDHCHRTNLVRGLLCRDCNLAAGKLNEDPARIMRLAAYIRAHNTKAADLIGLAIPLPTQHRPRKITG